MRDDDGDDLTAAERDALAAMGSDWTSPAGLRARVAGEARVRGLLARPARTSRRALWGAAAAAAAIAFTAGTWVGTRWSAPDPTRPEEPMPSAAQSHYLLLLYEDESYDVPADAAAHAARAREYGDWMRGLQKAGRVTGGDELAGDGRTLRRVGDEVASAPLGQDRERGLLGGYFRISAASDEDAAALARQCPHLRYGGTVEIRRAVP